MNTKKKCNMSKNDKYEKNSNRNGFPIPRLM